MEPTLAVCRFRKTLHPVERRTCKGRARTSWSFGASFEFPSF